jgi:hypothetical protein
MRNLAGPRARRQWPALRQALADLRLGPRREEAASGRRHRAAAWALALGARSGTRRPVRALGFVSQILRHRNPPDSAAARVRSVSPRLVAGRTPSSWPPRSGSFALAPMASGTPPGSLCRPSGSFSVASRPKLTRSRDRSGAFSRQKRRVRAFRVTLFRATAPLRNPRTAPSKRSSCDAGNSEDFGLAFARPSVADTRKKCKLLCPGRYLLAIIGCRGTARSPSDPRPSSRPLVAAFP